MPPKSRAAPTHTEHNVYITSSVTFDNGKDDFGRLQIYQAFSSLDEANEFSEAKADELAMNLDIEAPSPTLDNYSKDGTFRMELPLEHRKRDVTVETLIMPLMGGIIMHDKPVSRKTPKSTKNNKLKLTKSKAKKSQASDEEEEPDQDVDMNSEPVSPKTTKAARKNSKSSNKGLDAEKRDSVVDPKAVTEADIAAAPTGTLGCLGYYFTSYTVFGHHEYWSEAQIKVIIRTFGGRVNKTLPVYNNNDNHQLVVGADVPSNILRRIKQKEFKPITPTELLARIRVIPEMPGKPAPQLFTKEEIAKICKKVPGKPVVRTRIVKKEETDSDEDVKDSKDLESADEEL
ncbi:hypothetical protein E4T52_03987 [Aureobasidium sp. EXF-3400]|nr:hypothetical protein E4T51_04456 [Aureobasidium sp. EXF-12344]KAI4781125.1 hypothetical protein E4T52_03987 [Aureobasidium sp. EXF-3400]